MEDIDRKTLMLSGRALSDYQTEILNWRESMKIIAMATDIDLDVILLNVQTAAVYQEGSSSDFVIGNLIHTELMARQGRTINSIVGFSNRLINDLRKKQEEAIRNRPATRHQRFSGFL